MWKLPEGAEFVLKRLQASGFQGYVVGGCVRDTLLGRQPKDWDVASNALPKDMQRIFAGCHVIETGLQHGTLTVMYHHEPFEVTTFRVDGEYTDHRHPDEVIFVADVEKDLSRRDFTVNAMAWSPETGVVDVFGGQEDLAAGIIRCVGDPYKRFDEDALRIMRALRFASVYGFQIAPETEAAIHELKHTLTGVAAERIRVELQKLLCGNGAGDILREYRDVILTVLPPLEAVEWKHAVRMVENVPYTETMRLTMLMLHAGAEQARAMLSALKVDNATRDRVLTLVQNHQCCLMPERHTMLKLLSSFGEEIVRQLLTVRRAEMIADDVRPLQDVQTDIAAVEAVLEAVLADGICYTIKNMAVNGRDLMALGAKGRAVGECLEYLLSLLLAEKLPNERELLLEAARMHINEAECIK